VSKREKDKKLKADKPGPFFKKATGFRKIKSVKNLRKPQNLKNLDVKS
jgi:hypothetical protein